jgi:hypothetical protein
VSDESLVARLLDLAREILREVGSPPQWRIIGAEQQHEIDPLNGDIVPFTMLLLSHDGEPVGTLPTLTGDVPDDLALTAFVEQVYDTLVEDSWGEVNRPCPGHRHPSWPTVREGELFWHCPTDPHRWDTWKPGYRENHPS